MAIYTKSNNEQVTHKPKECARCGCKDIITKGARKFCRHCGKPYIHHLEKAEPPPPPKPDGVTYHVMRCPDCNSDKVRVTRTVRPIRYHKCKDCGCNFKSVEA